MKRILLGWLLPIALLACNLSNPTRFQAAPTPTPSPSPTATVTLTATPLPTLTPIPTPQPEARVATGDQAVFYGDWESALAEYQAARAASSQPDIQAAAALGIGRVHYLTGQYATALDALRGVVNTFPDSPSAPRAYFALAQSLTELDRFVEAAEAYQAYLFLRPGLIDAYVQERRGDALVSAGRYQSAIEAYQAGLQADRISDGLEMEIKIARAYAAQGDLETALVMYQDIQARTGNDYTKAQMDLLAGQAYLNLGQVEQGYAAYQHAIENYPLSYDSYTALVALVEAGVPVNEFDRGLVDYYAGQYGVAVAAFDRYLSSGETLLAPAARYYKGLSLRALRDYNAAIAEWETVIQNSPQDENWSAAWEAKAFTQWAYLDQYPQAAQTLLDFVTILPQHPRAAEFLFDAARIMERFGDLNQAAVLWERVGASYPLYEKAHKALFLAGISRYRLRDYAGAEVNFQASLNLAARPAELAASHLWIGKCESVLGDSAAARGAWERAAIADPTGYYSVRAHDLLQGRAPFTPPQAYDLALETFAGRAQAEAWMRATFSLAQDIDLSNLGSLADDPRLQRGAELWRLGLYEQARLEFENLRQAVRTDPAMSYRLANYLVEMGLYRTAIFAARQVLTLAGMDDAATLSAPPYFNHIRFGIYYSELVIPVAQAYNFHPLFIYSVMRQESLFEGFVRSSAGARGLMQIIPSTGQSIFELNGWPLDYTAEDLYRPKVNITFGVDYLDDQRRVFEGDLYTALAAYNGGPGNANAWKKLAPDDPDLFLEVIRFDETQRYIRGITEIFAIYRQLYDRSP